MKDDALFYHDGIWYDPDGSLEITLRDGTTHKQSNYGWRAVAGVIMIRIGSQEHKACNQVQELYQQHIGRLVMA